MGDRASVWFNAVLRGDSDDLIIGEETNIQDCAVLHTDPGIPLRLGRGVTVEQRLGDRRQRDQQRVDEGDHPRQRPRIQNSRGIR